MVLCLETSISPHNIHIGKIDHIPIFIDKMYELIIKRISNKFKYSIHYELQILELISKLNL